MTRLIDETGNTYGLLTVRSRAVVQDRYGLARWLAECECGGTVVVSGASLRRGDRDHCGCRNRERIARSSTKHGLSRTPAAKRVYSLRSRAVDQGVPCDLSPGDLPTIPDCCPILGIELREEAYCRDYNYPEIDRVVPGLGYVKGNIRWISRSANRKKSDLNAEEAMWVAAYCMGTPSNLMGWREFQQEI